MFKMAVILCLAGLLIIAGCVKPGLTCPSGTTDCQGECADLRSDDNHCGRCDYACPDRFHCNNSGCVPPDDWFTCRENETQCGRFCENLNTSLFNCGACGTQCSFDLPIQTCCSGTCKNLETDPDSCGTCGNECSVGEICCAGSCVTIAESTCTCTPACQDGLTCCNRQCVNLRNNKENCGSCGHVCRYPDFCQAGLCVHTIP
jgi:hypothetical protein